MADISLVFDATVAEAETGLVEIFSIKDLDSRFGRGCWRPDERFIVRQGPKNRPCESCRASEKNATALTHENVQFAPHDPAATTGRYFARLASEQGWTLHWEMGASSDDEPDAYKSSAAAQPQYTVLFFINPDADPTDDSSSVLAAIPRGLNLGLSAAVLHYCRKPALITAFLRRFLWVPVDSYVDDYQVAEPDFSRGPEAPAAGCHLRHPLSGQAMLWAACALFGMRPLRLDKPTPWSSGPCPFVGVILVNIKPSTSEK